ncbi:hypothetical protein H9P43_006664 [Blastocladiella emersonii ATCC 22665]|nr:hypothetical protein H9P43_006664 [Blastocladiella emersonii ATCC 22665]
MTSKTTHNEAAIQHAVTTRWLAFLRKAMIVYTALASVFFLATALNSAFNLLPAKDDPTLVDTLANQFYFLLAEVKDSVYAVVVLAVIGLAMSVFGLVAFTRRSAPLVRIYFFWSLLHVLAYVATMIATLFLMARENPGTHVISDPKPIDARDARRSWIILLTVLLPDFVLWSLVRLAAVYFARVYYVEATLLAKMEKPATA